MFRNVLPAIVFASFVATPAALLSTSVPVMAQDQKAAQTRIRGTIVSFGGTTLKVKTREGDTQDVKLADGWKLASVASAKITDIKAGDFVGIASLPKDQGGDGALEVLIFPPVMKGTGEGSYSWDLKPNSSMTNATVADAVKDVDGRTLTMSYQGKEKKISVPEGTPVVTLAPATNDDLVAGATVFISAEKTSTGPVAHQVVVGKNGVVPPM